MSFLFSYPFWITSGSVPLLYVGFLFALSMFSLVGAAFLYKIAKVKNHSKSSRALCARLQSFCLTFGFLGVLWSVFYYEGAYILSMRFWLLLIGIVAIIRLVMIFFAYRRESVPASVNMAEKLYRKYLPR